MMEKLVIAETAPCVLILYTIVGKPVARHITQSKMLTQRKLTILNIIVIIMLVMDGTKGFRMVAILMP